MSEYWVSKKKYYCKYCDIYIAEDAPSRQQHENGLRHKGNVDRFIRGLYKSSEKRKKDQDEEKRDMARVEHAAQAAYAQDVAAGLAKPGAGPVASTSAAARKSAPKPANPFSNYSTAESLGFTDPDAERVAAELERRRTQGLAGEWEVVATIPSARAPASDDEEADEKSDTAEAGEGPGAGVKREAEAPPDDEDARQFKLRKKTLAVGGYDPGAIPIKLKEKKEEVLEPAVLPASTSTSTSSGTPKPTDAPKWTKVAWRRPGDAEPAKDISVETPTPSGAQTDAFEPLAPASVPVKSDLELPIPSAPIEKEQKSSITAAKKEETTPPLPEAGSMFRKRKAPAGGSRGSGRRS